MNTLPQKADGLISSVSDLWSPEQFDVIQKALCPGAPPAALQVFAEVCRSSRMNPFLKEIYLLNVGSGRFIPFVAIDGFHVIGARDGTVTPPRVEFQGDGAALEARAVGEVLRSGRWVPLETQWIPMAERKPADGRDATWRKMPKTMLGKCVMALYYRMSGCQGMQGLALVDEKHLYSETPDASFECEECGTALKASEASLSKKSHGRALCRDHRQVGTPQPKTTPAEDVPAGTPAEPAPEPQTPASDADVDGLRAALNSLNSAQARQCFTRAGVPWTKDLATLKPEQVAALRIEAERA